MYYRCHNFYQVIIEGVWGNNRASGFIAVDDVTIFEGKKQLQHKLFCFALLIRMMSSLYVVCISLSHEMYVTLSWR